jgi:putative phage-type endonuclease
MTSLPPKIITLEQRTPEWHAWRRGEDLFDGAARITASMQAQILGISPYGNAYDLWMELTGRRPPKVSNRAMQRGVDLEPIAREKYMQHTNISVEDVCVEHPTIPWVAASLDGYSVLEDVVVEIKCPGAEEHANAILGQIPEKYVCQVQWQLFCCPSAKKAHFWSFDGKEGVLVEVLPDPKFQDFMYRVALQFRQCLIDDVPPNGEEFADLALEIRNLYQQKSEIEESYKKATQRIAILLPEYSKSAAFAGVSVSRSQSSGRIDYEALIKHLNVPIETVELFRKASKGESFRVSVNMDAVVPEYGKQRQTLLLPEDTTVAW